QRSTLFPYTTLFRSDVAVGGLDAEGIEDVFATFTSEPTDGRNSLYGKWTSVPLRLSSRFSNGIGLIQHYTGSIDTSGTGANPESVRLFVQAVSGTGLVSLTTDNGAYYQFVPETATLANPKAATSLALQPPATPYVATYRSRFTVSALLSDAVTRAPIGNRGVTFTLGRASARALTDATTGVATATLPVLVAPDAPPPRVTVGFAEDPNFLGSGDARDVTIARAPTMLVASPTSVRYAD